MRYFESYNVDQCTYCQADIKYFGTVTTSMIMLVQDGDQDDKDFNDNLTNECHHWPLHQSTFRLKPTKTNRSMMMKNEEKEVE